MAFFTKMRSSVAMNYMKTLPGKIDPNIALMAGAAAFAIGGTAHQIHTYRQDRREGKGVGRSLVGAWGTGLAWNAAAIGGIYGASAASKYGPGMKTLAGNMMRNPRPMANAMRRAGTAKAGMMRNLVKSLF
jgi:hypothetical protein